MVEYWGTKDTIESENRYICTKIRRLWKFKLDEEVDKWGCKYE